MESKNRKRKQKFDVSLKNFLYFFLHMMAINWLPAITGTMIGRNIVYEKADVVVNFFWVG